MNTLVISIFQGCGRHYLYNYVADISKHVEGMISIKNFDVEDWKSVFKIANEIESEIGTVDFILIPCNHHLLTELRSRNIPIVIITPANPETDKEQLAQIKEQLIGKNILKLLQNNDKFAIEKISKFIEDFKYWTSNAVIENYSPVSFWALGANNYVLQEIKNWYWKKETYPEIYCLEKGNRI